HTLLARLEYEVDGAVELARFGQILGGAEQHCGVSIVTAGMHDACPTALIGGTRPLVDRQSIHIGAQSDRARAIAAAEHANHACSIDETMHLYAPGHEEARNDIGRAVRLQAELGMGVDIAADAGELRVMRAQALERRVAGNWLGHITSSMGAA